MRCLLENTVGVGPVLIILLQAVGPLLHCPKQLMPLLIRLLSNKFSGHFNQHYTDIHLSICLL
jgi:hypothetical protein